MSSKLKKSTARGVRYTDAKKKEIVSFVASYNKVNGRGGQNQAATKFQISPLTVAAWLKADSKGDAPKSGKEKLTSSKVKPFGASRMGVRYSPEKKQEVVDFVLSYNAANGRGGQNQAAKKFDLSVLTVSAWLKGLGSKSTKKAVKAAPAKKAAKNSVAKNSTSINDLEALKAAIRALVN